ncbi:hypothetical protein PG988_003954 [Apiospora saccharicola]
MPPMADFHPTRQIDWAAEWPKYKFNKNGNLIVPDHLEKTLRTTLICQLYYSKSTPALQSAELFISSFMIELHNRLGKDPLANWIYSTPHYQQSGAALTEYSVLKRAAKDLSLSPTDIVALVLTNGQSTSLPQTLPAVEVPPAENTRDVADPDAATAKMDSYRPFSHNLKDTESQEKTPSDTDSSQPRSHTMEDTKCQEEARSSDNVTCGNCRRRGHTIRDCIGPLDAEGWLSGCPVCNDAGHLYHDCIRRSMITPGEQYDWDWKYLLYYRQNKPSIKCSIDWTAVYNEIHPLMIALPWRPAFALEQSNTNEGIPRPARKGFTWRTYEYNWVGNPDLEARTRMPDPDVDKLAKHHLAASGIRWEPTDDYLP